MFKAFQEITGSIGVKFAVAMMAMAAMTAASGAVSFFAFQKISSQFRILVDEHVVELQQASKIIEVADDLKGGLTDVLLAQSNEDLADRMTEVNKFIAEASAQISRLPEDEMTSMGAMLETVTSGLEELAQARAHEFDQQDVIQASITALSALSDQAHSTLNFQADDALYELKVGSGKTIITIDKALTKLVETDFMTLQLLLQVRVESNLLAGILIALSETSDTALRSILDDLGNGAVGRMERYLPELSELGVAEEILKPLEEAAEFFRLALGTNSMGRFALRRQTLSIRQSSDTALSTAVDDIIFFLTIETESVSSENAAKIRALMDNQVKKITTIANLQAAVENIFTLSLEAINIHDVTELVAIQNRLSGAAIKLIKYSKQNSEALVAISNEVILMADIETGVVAKQRTLLDARAQSAEISRKDVDSVSQIASLARKFGRRVMTKMTDAGISTATEIETSKQSMILILLTSAAIFLVTLGAIYLSVVRPLGMVSRSTERLAGGDMSALDTLKRRRGEIGRLTEALMVFRSNLIANKKMEEDEKKRARLEREEERKAEAAQQEEDAQNRKRATEREREERKAQETKQANEAARRQAEDAQNERRREEQAGVVSALAQGLTALATGNLGYRIEAKFPQAYDQLRADFNATVSVLEEVIRSISKSGKTIFSNAEEISDAADNLSRRTESSASTLEETSAALGELTKAVQTTAQGAIKADALVSGAQKGAERSGEVVRETVLAMAEIEKSSRKISKIINLIDDIAFQTNLLALNAGVEAARAGDAGRGFAVVATEVRSLAHRSSDAAKEISSLISQSGTQVERGVSLVDETGAALQTIVGAVANISAHVSEIARSAEEQASGVSEINAAILQLDQATQQNTAMFEETTAATHSLTGEASELFHLISKFNIDGEADAATLDNETTERLEDASGNPEADSFEQNSLSQDESRENATYRMAGE